MHQITLFTLLFAALVGTLGTILLGNVLSGIGIVRAGSGKGILKAGYGKEWDFSYRPIL